MEYLLVKWVHILSSTVLFGTGVGSAFYLLVASLRGTPAATAFVARFVVIADWMFTAPAALLQPATGLYLIKLAGIPWSSRWVSWSIGLYLVALACWLPVVPLQIRLRDLATQAAAQQAALPTAYRRIFKWWVALGTVALLAFVAIFYLMVAKPF